MKPNVAAIRDLVSCKSEEMKEVATRHKIELHPAAVIRDHWTRRLSGLCVRCELLVKGKKCPRCGTVVEETISLLEKIKPGTPLLRRQCTKCEKTFSHNAGYVLELTKKYGSFIPSKLCRDCKTGAGSQKKVKSKKRRTSKKSKGKIVKKKVLADTTLYAGDLPHGLRQTPFMLLKSLKLQNERSILGQEK